MVAPVTSARIAPAVPGVQESDMVEAEGKMTRPESKFDTPRDAAVELYMNCLEFRIKMLTDVVLKLEQRAEAAEEELRKR